MSDSNRFSRLHPDDTARIHRKRSAQTRTRGHAVLERLLMLVFVGVMVLTGLAIYSAYAPSFKRVPNTFAEGVKDDRVNIVVIGIGGDDHPGGGKDLADALMMLSLRPSTGEVAVISIPRDLYVPVGRYGTHRINRAHAIGNQTGYPGAGPGLTTETVETVLEQPVHAYVRIDFAAFKKLIDDVGGVEIDVEEGFYDYLFRDRFEAGLQRMNGDRALRYVRYRYISGSQGSNYARERRQQQVMMALAEKLRSINPTDLPKLMKTARTVSRHTETNLSISQIAWLYRRFSGTSLNSIQMVSLEPLTEPFEVRTISDPGEAVRTLSGDYEEIRDASAQVFSKSASEPPMTAAENAVRTQLFTQAATVSR